MLQGFLVFHLWLPPCFVLCVEKPFCLPFRDLLNQHLENRRRQSWIPQATRERPYKLQQEKEGGWDNRGDPAVPEPALLLEGGIWHQGEWHHFLLGWFCQLTDQKDRLNSHRFSLTEPQTCHKPSLGSHWKKGQKAQCLHFLGFVSFFSQLLEHW